MRIPSNKKRESDCEYIGQDGHGAGTDRIELHETEIMNSDWDEISFVISSRYRVIALRRLAKGPATPSQIASDADVGIAHVSRALQGLRERSLVDLLVSEDRKKGRVYGLTDHGREVWETIEAENLV
jgi:DNA-binding transcriptional ArsR family regulator